MSKELKKYGLRPARKPLPLGPLSTVVLVTGAGIQHATAFIHYAAEFLEAVGRKLTRGVSSHDPAYISVVHCPRNRTWDIWALYLSDGSGCILWRTDSLPSWLKLNPVNTHDNTHKAAHAPKPFNGSAGTHPYPARRRGLPDPAKARSKAFA